MKILVGFILRPDGMAAVNRGIDEARIRGAELIILHSSRGGPDEALEAVLEYREALQELDSRLQHLGLDYRIEEHVQGHDPVDDLLEVAEAESVDLIVVGMRRRSPVGKLVLGSQAQKILLRAPCPVLAVHIDD